MSWSKTKNHYYKWIIPTTHLIDENDPSKGVYLCMDKIEKKLFNTYYKATDSLGIHYKNMLDAQVVRVEMPKINTIVEAKVVDILAAKNILQWGNELKAYLKLDNWTLISGPADWKEQLRKFKPAKPKKPKWGPGSKNWNIYNKLEYRD